MTTPQPDPDELVKRRVQQMKDDELVDFIRDTVTRLDALADRLEVLADRKEGGQSAGTDSA